MTQARSFVALSSMCVVLGAGGMAHADATQVTLPGAHRVHFVWDDLPFDLDSFEPR